jgi:hypothetical protein
MPATTLSQAATIENAWFLSSFWLQKSRYSLRIAGIMPRESFSGNFVAELRAGASCRDQSGRPLLEKIFGYLRAEMAGLFARSRSFRSQTLRAVGM